MPNWIEGTIRVRGKEKDVFNFYAHAFEKLRLVFDEGYKVCEYVVDEKNNVRVKDYGDYECEVCIPCDSWLRGSRRAFSNESHEIWFDNKDSDGMVTKVLPLRQAWGWFEDDYKKLSEQYNVDIRVIGWERGMQYKGEVIALCGKEPIYQETKYDDWDWDAECPFLGG